MRRWQGRVANTYSAKDRQNMTLGVVASLRRRTRVMHASIVLLIIGQGVTLSPLMASELIGRAVVVGQWTAQTAQSVQGRVSTPAVRVNRTVPRVSAPSYTVDFGPAPSVETLAAARLFPEPLVPVGAIPSVSENIALARALERYAGAGTRPGRVQLLEDYLRAEPASPWRASVAANLGTVLWREGYFSRAATYWAMAWETAKSATVSRERAVAEHAIGELMMHHMTFGQVAPLEARVKELEGYPITGTAGTRVETARDGLWILHNEHDMAVFSGPTALLSLMDQVGTPTATSRETIHRYQPSHSGTTLSQLNALADRAGLRLVSRKVEHAAEIPVPAVIHLRSDHYSTVIERRDGGYVLRDPALGGLMLLSDVALQDEMSGFILVLERSAGIGRAVSDEEAAQVVGHCIGGTPGHDEPCEGSCSPEGPSPSPGSDSGPGSPPPPAPPPPPGGGPGNPPANGGDGPGDTGGGDGDVDADSGEAPGGTDSCGMPMYRLHLMSATTKVADRPCGYTPPIGPSVSLQLRYASRSTRLPQIPDYGHVGPLWSHDWMSWVEDNNTSYAAPYSWENVVVRGDTFEQYQQLQRVHALAQSGDVSKGEP